MSFATYLCCHRSWECKHTTIALNVLVNETMIKITTIIYIFGDNQHFSFMYHQKPSIFPDVRSLGLQEIYICCNIRH